MPTQQHVDAYLASFRVNDRSPRTIRGYGQELTRLVRLRIPLTTAALALYLETAAGGRPCARSTYNWRLTALRGFCQFLVSRRELSGNPAQRLKRRRRIHVMRMTLSVDDVRRALTAVGGSSSSRRLRDETLIVLFAHTGLRVAELCRLTLGQVDLQHARLVHVVRKRGRVMPIHLNAEAAWALRRWLDSRGTANPTGPLFPGRGAALTPRAVQRRFQQIARLAGLPRMNPHELRHFFATSLRRVDVELDVVQILMAHESISTTQQYLHADERPLVAAVNRLETLRR